MRRLARLGAAALAALGAAAASAPMRARAEIDTRLVLGSYLYTESDAAAEASTTTLAYGDLRGVVDGRRLGGSGVELRGDFRLRLTGDFSRADAVTGGAQTTARGYLGGREYELREGWVGWRGASLELRVGRQRVIEADALRVDGALASWQLSPAWRASLFGGLSPSPFARSLPDDYLSSSSLAYAVGGDVGYTTPRSWGTLAVASSIFGGADDGGTIDPAAPAARPGRTEAARVFVAASEYARATSWLDLHGDLVLDLAGAAGVQVTRGDLGATARSSRLVVEAGYAHLSSLAVEMYLLALLGDRRGWQPGTVESNLVVERTARDEGRLRAEVRPAGRLWLYGEGRLRRRALVEPDADPHFHDAAPAAAWDVTLGARDHGDLAGVRLGAALSEITDFRAETRLLVVDAGRDFAGERLSLDADLAIASTRDAGSGQPACALPWRTLAAGCFGRRAGTVYQVGASAALRASARWFVLVDYRLVLDATDGSRTTTGHSLYGRIELRL